MGRAAGRVSGPPVPDVGPGDVLELLSRRSLDVAPSLIGAVVRSRVDGRSVSVRLTEVEAYEGTDDPGSHAYRGRTARNQVMFGPPGHVYVYRHLGLHHCVNVVCGPEGLASAVLLRAGEVVAGEAVAWQRRTEGRGVCRQSVDLARGPARLAVVLGLTQQHDGASVLDAGGLLTLAVGAGPPPGRVRSGPRVGVSGVGGDPERHPWRYWLDDEPTVSAYRAASARKRSSRPPTDPVRRRRTPPGGTT
jgi:DNA-3-methyladenine glycosylase